MVPDRPSVIDVFENSLGEAVGPALPKVLRKLPKKRAAALLTELDKFLAAQADEGCFSAEAVLVDETSGDIFFKYFDADQPSLSDHTKRLLLLYPEIITQWGYLTSGHDQFGVDFLDYLGRYVSAHAELLRTHAITPISPRLADVEPIWEIAFDASLRNATQRFAKYAHPHLPILADLPIARVREDLEAYLFGLYKDCLLSGHLKLSPVFLDSSQAALFEYHLRSKRQPTAFTARTASQTAHTFITIDVPGLSDLSEADLVAIRVNSDAFYEFRDCLARSVRKASRDARGLDDLNECFQDNLGEIREKAARLEEHVRSTSFRYSVKSITQSLTIGAAGLAATSPIVRLLGQDPSLLKDYVKLAPFAGLSIIWWLLFHRSPREKRLLLRFYHALYPRNV